MNKLSKKNRIKSNKKEKEIQTKIKKATGLLSYREKEEFLVFGYIREYQQITSIPTELTELCFNFYHSPYKICKFSKIYQSKNAFEMLEDDKCIKRIVKEGCHYILADTDPVWTGSHCWRVQVYFEYLYK